MGVNLTPSVFQISSETPSNFSEKNKVVLEASICDLPVVRSMQLRVDPTQSYGKTTKSPIQDVHRFRAIKTH